MIPDLFSIGPFTLHSFGLMMALGFVAAGYFLSRAMVHEGYDGGHAWEILIGAAVGGVLGAKVDFVIQNGSEGGFFSGSGLVWYGGVIGGAIGVIAVTAWRKIPIGRLANLAGPGLAIGYAIGRIGCQLSGDGDYGRPTSLPWGMSYPEGEVPTTEIVHPTPVYETAAMLVVFFVLWRLRGRFQRPWQLFGVWALLAGAERFLVEFVRRNQDVAIGLTAAQLFSVGLMAIGAVLMVGRGGTGHTR